MNRPSQLKAIETRYNGYRFRSRLEARWAVFFDQAGIRYEYEPEGFVLDGQNYLPDFFLPDIGAWFEVKGPYPSEMEKRLAQLLSAGTRMPCLMANGPIDINAKKDGTYCVRHDSAGIGIFMGELWQTWDHYLFDDKNRGQFGSWLRCDRELFTIIGVPAGELQNESQRKIALEKYISAMEADADYGGILEDLKAGRRDYCQPFDDDLPDDFQHGFADFRIGIGMVFDKDSESGAVVIRGSGSDKHVKKAYLAAMQCRFEHGETPTPPRRSA